ncbi:MAG: PKD domain-containing protein, partial [Planctomycetota bacterium]
MLPAHSRTRVFLLVVLVGALGCAELLEVPAGPSEVRLKVGEEIVLDGSGSFDPEGEKLTCRWRQVAGPEVELKGAETPWPSFTPTGPGRYEFELVVARPKGERGPEPAAAES